MTFLTKATDSALLAIQNMQDVRAAAMDHTAKNVIRVI
jgi:hypothetical protein